MTWGMLALGGMRDRDKLVCSGEGRSGRAHTEILCVFNFSLLPCTLHSPPVRQTGSVR